MFDSFIELVRNWYHTEDFIPLHEPRFGETDKAYVADAIDSTFVSSVGEYVNRFEKELAGYTEAKRAVAVMNGTAALHIALHVAGVGPEDEVITQPLTFVATANAIRYTGADPVFLDVDKDTMGLSPDAVETFFCQSCTKKADGVYNRKTGKRISAIVPMHTFGHPARMKELVEIGDEWGIPVVEDAAEALGSYRNHTHCGRFGTLGIFSFNGNKTITCGGGGALVTDDEALADRIKHLTTTAKKPHLWEYAHDAVGFNYRMPNLNAALACAQLGHLEDFLKDKRELAGAYGDFFKEVEWGDFFFEPENCTSNYWLCAVILADEAQRDKFLETTNAKGIMTRPIWKLMNHLPMYSACLTESLENAEWLYQRVVNIPSSARMNVV